VREFQAAMMRVKYAQVPVVAALGGMALGGGCELALHSAKRVASFETYMGLVEVGVGLIPGGGGLKEGALRAAAAAAAAGSTDLLAFLAGWFQNAAMAKVSTSALEAQRMGYLLPSDRIVFHRHELLWTAIGEAFALHALGYRPPIRGRLFPAAGRSVLATIKAQAVNLREGALIGPHDFHLASCVAETMCGGDLDPGTLVDEQWFLDLESRNFEQLVAHPKTQERIMGFMQSGKPVRN
jgi:3-hydroxyacyl-CoA dehydrogenase